MEILKTIKEKSFTRKEADVKKDSENLITLSDFNNQIYIAYLNTPLIHLDENLTAKEVIVELNKIRDNYINSKLKLC